MQAEARILSCFCFFLQKKRIFHIDGEYEEIERCWCGTYLLTQTVYIEDGTQERGIVSHGNTG